MTETINISAEELDSLKNRLEKLATEKSYLNLLIHMMSRLSVVSGLENTVEAMLEVILNNIGGTKLILYYIIDDNIYYADVFGEKMKLDVIEDASVKKVLESREPVVYEHDFSETMMLTPEFTKAMTWVFPLLVGTDLVGVLKMEGMHIGTGALWQQLPTFFSYAALILKNEILGHTRLQKAYDELKQVNKELANEIAERNKAEEEIRRLNEELEQKVEERTKQLIQAQEELVRKEKLAILGQLAGVVGHEIRNPLGVMNNAVYFLKTVMPDANDTVKEYLDIIKQEISNSQCIITDLLDFARTKTPRIVPVTVNVTVTQALDKCTIPENIDVRTNIPDALPEVNVDPFQMGQVLQNLITNAIQAMPGGGTLTVTTRQRSGIRDQGSNTEPRTPFPDTEFIEITVNDTGEGIPSENMERLFQPLFTTKTRGIGLGLVVCKNLVEANGGRIEVKSVYGKGTTFILTLPLRGKAETL